MFFFFNQSRTFPSKIFWPIRPKRLANGQQKFKKVSRLRDFAGSPAGPVFGWPIFECVKCINSWGLVPRLVPRLAPGHPSPNPHFNRPLGHWPCVKSCLVGGSNKYRPRDFEKEDRHASHSDKNKELWRLINQARIPTLYRDGLWLTDHSHTQ